MFPAAQPGGRRPPRAYEVDDVHPTAACPWCGSRMVLRRGPMRTFFWACIGGAQRKCRGTRMAMPGLEPDLTACLSMKDYYDLKTLLLGLIRDELCTWTDGMTAIYAQIHRQSALKYLAPQEVGVARQALLDLRERLDAERQAQQPAVPRVERPCCETIRDAYGSMTICWDKMRWCLGIAPHATRPEHTAENEGVTWGAGTEQELREDAQEAFREADSRRR